MKLRNKKTGEIRPAEAREDGIYLYDETTEQWYKYELDLLAKWWGYYKENNYYWYIDDMGMPSSCSKHHDKTAKRKAFGNYFETKEEAEKAVERLKAWKRLKDKGFRFIDHIDRDTGQGMTRYEWDGYVNGEDIDLLFGGEE